MITLNRLKYKIGITAESMLHLGELNVSFQLLIDAKYKFYEPHVFTYRCIEQLRLETRNIDFSKII